MSELSSEIRKTGLYNKLSSDKELCDALCGMRGIASALASTISNSVPSFTDHSVRHMDALWVVTDSVLTVGEIEQLTCAEAFLLASAFYLHDLGMAYAATLEGRDRCLKSNHYNSFVSCLPENEKKNGEINAQALSFAVRKMHAAAAHELSVSKVPGTEYYLFESKDFRDAWGTTCGQIAASHHWDIDKVDVELGRLGVLPLPGGRSGDLGYVASILRVVDFAHINRDRALSIERAFRSPMATDSLIHWLAQENIDGPVRDGHELMYRSAGSISNVDSWWLYYEMLSSLDAEIRSVQRYLKRRTSSLSRFSLQGVLGASSPEEASMYVKPDSFMPIEVNLRTGSIDRLVKLLAGESLYGPDPMAAVRELLQNANDAVRLKYHTASDEWDEHVAKLPIKVDYYQEDERFYLVVSDFGVGMSARVMTDYLISIASNYWESQFFTDFPNATARGFSHAGKFGIGFLSVFMLGDEIEVTSNRVAGDRTVLKLHGVGRRGELRGAPFSAKSGTSVKIRLRDSVVARLGFIERLVRSYAPMLSTSIKTTVFGKEYLLQPGWLFDLSASEFKEQVLLIINDLRGVQVSSRYHDERDSENYYGKVWGGGAPEFTTDKVRLVVSPASKSVLCLKGLSLQVIATPGFVGVIEVEDVTPDVSRRRALDFDCSSVLQQASLAVMSELVSGFEAYCSEGLMLEKIQVVANAVSTYGKQVLTGSKIKWISNISLPGEVSVCDTLKLRELLGANDIVFIAYDAQPWTAMKLWTRGTENVTGEAAFLLGELGGGPGYTREVHYKRDSFLNIWPRFQNNVMLGLLVEIIAEVWGVSVEHLTGQDGWRHEGGTVFGRFQKMIPK